MTTYPRRLIEVDLPIKEISAHARREKSIRHGHISTLHIWWARRPLAACRAVLCAALWPDPVDPLTPQVFRDEAARILCEFAEKARTERQVMELVQKHYSAWNRTKAGTLNPEKETHWPEIRYRLLDFIADFANWDASTVPAFLETSRALTQAAHEALGGEPGTRPLVVDPFAGGGAMPIEASRIGTDSYATDLNPISVLLNKVSLEIVPKYGARLAETVREIGEQVRSAAWELLGNLYPLNPDGSTTIAWISARTVRCEGPACGLTYPIVGQTWVSRNKNGGEEIRLNVTGNKVISSVVSVKHNLSNISKAIKTSKGSSAICPLCNYSMNSATIQRQLSERNGGTADAQLLAVICRSADGKQKYARSPSNYDELIHAQIEKSKSEIGKVRPKQPFPVWDSRAFVPGLYGVTEWGYMHTPRQILTLHTFAELIKETTASIEKSDHEFGRAVRLLLGLCLGRLVDTSASTCRWVAGTPERGGSFIAAANGGEKHLRWITDFAESNPFSGETGSWNNQLGWVVRVIENLVLAGLRPGHVMQASATAHPLPNDSADILATDPPYGSAVPYSDLADFFYVWLRRALQDAYPDLLTSELTPKREEAVVNLRTPGDDRGEKSEATYHNAMTASLKRAREVLQPAGMGVIVFADKRTSEWEAMLGAVLSAGWTITASWPMDTERPGRTRSLKSASLSSSIHLVCRPRENPDGSVRGDDVGDWRTVLSELPKRIHDWMPRLAAEGVVGADAIFACLGPALEIFSRYSRVEKVSGEQVTLKEYLEHVWAAVSREALSLVFEGADATGFEPDARLTAMWLWTLGAGPATVNGGTDADEGEDASDDDEEGGGKGKSAGGYVLEFDAARKIAQGLGARLEELKHVVEVKGAKARLLSMAERAKHLFEKSDAETPAAKKAAKKKSQLSLFAALKEVAEEQNWNETGAPKAGTTSLDRVHQAMLLFASGRGEALKRFLVEEGVGKQAMFWKLSQALSALYPAGSEEKRWVDGVLARKKGLGF